MGDAAMQRVTAFYVHYEEGKGAALVCKNVFIYIYIYVVMLGGLLLLNGLTDYIRQTSKARRR
jgi:hypothetical protein